mgnify:CR=1 FL=1
MIYYKFLTANDLSPFQGMQWHLPQDKRPGKWMPRIEGDLFKCTRGYHAVAEDQPLVPWLHAHIYELEYREPPYRDGEKCWGNQARLVRRVFADTWTEQSARLLACRIADDVLPIFEARYPGDNRPRVAIDTARRYALGEATREAWAAAEAAAWDAAEAAAWDAAWAAAEAAARAAAETKYESWLWETLRGL